jgi:hypothetical protein
MTAHETCFALLVYLRCRQAGHVLPNEVKFAGFYRVVLGRACLLAGDLKRAIATLREWQNLDPEPVEPVLLATALYDNSQQEEAKILLREAVDAKRRSQLASGQGNKPLAAQMTWLIWWPCLKS